VFRCVPAFLWTFVKKIWNNSSLTQLIAFLGCLCKNKYFKNGLALFKAWVIQQMHMMAC
jgi:hypothetical protein